MLDNFKVKIKNMFDVNRYCTHSIAIFSIILFYIWMTSRALLIFQQFSFFEIITVSISFFFLFITLIMVFINNFFQKQIKFTIYNLFISSIIFIFMVIMENTVKYPFSEYYQTFPLIETEMGLGWQQDTVFHSSIIQSILNFGYPSIGQHGSPIIFYHVFSHYIDALILFITGLDVYASSGLLFYFKGFILISTIVIFISYLFEKFSIYIFLISILLITPIMIGTWHAIGSHGLWFTSIVFIISSPKVFSIFSKYERNSIQDFFFLTFLIIVIALGKVSTGFIYAVFVGFYLLLKDPKNKLVYVFGIMWITFFLFYKKLMTLNIKGTEELNFTWLNFNDIYYYVTNSSLMHIQIQTAIFTTIFLLFILTFVFRTKKNIIMITAAFSSYLVLLFITSISSNLSAYDISYFYYGLHSILLLYTLHILSYNLNLYELNPSRKLNNIEYRLVVVSILLSTIYLFSFYEKPNLSILNDPLKKQFTNSDKVIYTLENEELRFNNDLVLLNKLNGKLDLWTTGRDPIISFPSLNFSPQNNYILHINITVSRATNLQLFYTDANTNTYPWSDNHSLKFALLEGKNDIYIPLDYSNLGQNLRLDPVSSTNTFIKINSLEIKNTTNSRSTLMLYFLDFIHIDSKFSKINTFLTDSQTMSFPKIVKQPFASHLPNNIERPLLDFKNELNNFISKHKTSKSQTSLYISKEIFQKDIKKFKGPEWARGMLIYAITGMPLVYGIHNIQRTNYGYDSYDKGSLWLSEDKFDYNLACKMSSSKFIIKTKKFLKPRFELYICKDNF